MNENTLQEELNAVEVKLAAERDLGAQRDADKIATLEVEQARLLEAISQEEQQAAQMVRIQAQEEHKEGLSQFVQDLDLFETFFPKVKYAEVMGLSEYVDQQQLFNQILHQAFVQIEDQRNDKHNADIAERDEKVLALKSVIRHNSEQSDHQLKELNDLLERRNTDVEQLSEELSKQQIESQFCEIHAEKAVEELRQAKEQIDQLTAENEKLKEQIESSKALSPKPTASIADLLSQAKIKSAAEIAIDNYTPFRGKVILGETVAPPIAPEVPTFLYEHNQTDIPTDQLDETGFIPIPTDHQEVTFRPEEETQSGDAVDLRVSSTNGEGQTEARATTEERLTILEQSNLEMQTWIDSIEKRVGKLDGLPQQEVA